MENAVPRKILIVDDDYYFRNTLERSLAQCGHDTASAENVQEAQNVLTQRPFDLVISDINMPEQSGIDLLLWIKATRSLPVILMTGQIDLLKKYEDQKKHADGFLPKPFKREDLLGLIAGCLPDIGKFLSPKIEEANLDLQFCKISIDDFVYGREMKFDIFVRLSETNYVKIAHSGEDITPERILSYKGKKIPFLYLKKEDLQKYLELNLVLTTAVRSSSQISHTKKMNLIKHTSEVMLQGFFGSELKKEDFLQAGALVENAVSILSENSDAANLLIMLSTHTDFLYAHSVGVSLYSTLIGKALGWQAPSTIFKLALGGLLHDVGKKEIPRTILEKTRNDLTTDEIALLETHTIRGADILASLQCIPSEIIQIVHEHHENCLGCGYPSHLKKNKINPLAKVVAVANDFCELVLKNPDSMGYKPTEAIHRLMTFREKYYDEAALGALAGLFHVPGSLPDTEA
jgi:putative nucleotidyltransferase with HDIG domain